MNLKSLIETIINDLSSNANIDGIMLKAQTIAFYLKDENFKKWVECEQNGYCDGEMLPEYRKVSCRVKICGQSGFRRFNEFEFPIELVDEKYQERFSHIPFKDSLSEIERMGKGDGTLSMSIPAYMFNVMNQYVNGEIDGAWQYTSPIAASSIITKVKSKLLDFFMQLDDKMNMGIDLNKIEGKEGISNIVNNTILAGIVNSGSGTVNANDSTIVGGKDNHVRIDDTTRKEIQSLVEQIKNIKLDLEADEKDVASYIYEIQQELNKKVSMPDVIRKSLRALKGFTEIAADKMVSTGIDKLMMQL